MKKKLFLAICAAIVAAIVCAAIVSCAKPTGGIDSDLPDSYEGMTLTDKSAYELFTAAYDEYLQNKSYKRTQYYDFSSKIMTMKIKSVRKIAAEKVYNEEVVVGKGVLALNEGKRFYYDGARAYSIYFNDKKKVPAEGTGDALYTVKSWADYTDYAGSADELEAELTQYRSKMLLYDVSDKNYLAADSDDSVYEKDGLYYFTLKIDCSEAAMTAWQSGVAEAIAKKTGGDKKDLKMLKDTVLQAAVEIVGGKPRIKLMKTTENYKGKIAVFSAECEQQYYNVFDYSDGANAITEQDLLNLAG